MRYGILDCIVELENIAVSEIYCTEIVLVNSELHRNVAERLLIALCEIGIEGVEMLCLNEHHRNFHRHTFELSVLIFGEEVHSFEFNVVTAGVVNDADKRGVMELIDRIRSV